MEWLLVFFAGGAGSLARYLCSGFAQRIGGSGFPWGTLAVNVIGCLAIGVLAAMAGGKLHLDPRYRVPIFVGFLGGFTTFSSFGLETFHLLQHGRVGPAIANVAASLLAGLAAVWIGFRLGERLA